MKKSNCEEERLGEAKGFMSSVIICRPFSVYRAAANWPGRFGCAKCAIHNFDAYTAVRTTPSTRFESRFSYYLAKLKKLHFRGRISMAGGVQQRK